MKKLFFIGYIILPAVINRRCSLVYHRPAYHYDRRRGHHHYRKQSLDDPITASTNNHKHPEDNTNYEQQYRKYLKLYGT